MVFPRLLAMSEVVWKGPTTNLDKDYRDFLSRLEPYLKRLDSKDVNYANHLFDLEGTVIKKEATVLYELYTPTAGKEIKYSINGGEQLPYIKPVTISEDAIIAGQVYKNGAPVGRNYSDTIHYHKGINAKVGVSVVPHPAYGAGGIKALINGVSGSNTRFGDKEWLGFWGDDLEVTITFLEPTKISKISTRFYNANGQWLYTPKHWTAMITLENGSVLSNKEMIGDNGKIVSSEMLINTKDYLTRRIVLLIPSYGIIPDGLQGAGNKAWTFIDEIVVE
jgi:hexosaminidase